MGWLVRVEKLVRRDLTYSFPNKQFKTLQASQGKRKYFIHVDVSNYLFPSIS